MRHYLTSIVVSLLAVAVLLAATFSPTRTHGQVSPSSQGGPLPPGLPKPAKKAEYVGAEMCLSCHNYGQAKGWLQQPHGRFLMDPKRHFDGKGCEECHGPGSLHVADPPNAIMAIGKLGPRQANAICLKCHNSEISRHDWQVSSHALSKMRCSDCHKVHEPINNMLMLPKPKNELCFDCHKNIQNQFHQNSHHPVLEGKMDCVDCHNVHSGANDNMLQSDEKTTCTKCHADVHGPFIYEHDVTVNAYAQPCTSCHQPHGSPNLKLFKISGRGLCLQCHTAEAVNHFPGDCANCHSRIHGSNTNQDLLN